MFFRVALLVLRKDFTIEVKSREILYTTLLFAVSCVLVFAFALVKEGEAVVVGRFGARSRIKQGESIEAVVDTRALHFFDPATGQGIYETTNKGATT